MAGIFIINFLKWGVWPLPRAKALAWCKGRGGGASWQRHRQRVSGYSGRQLAVIANIAAGKPGLGPGDKVEEVG
ncbi:MAG: hypothetical protein ACRC16_01850, partial [Aeromonas salmonicida]